MLTADAEGRPVESVPGHDVSACGQDKEGWADRRAPRGSCRVLVVGEAVRVEAGRMK